MSIFKNTLQTGKAKYALNSVLRQNYFCYFYSFSKQHSLHKGFMEQNATPIKVVQS